MITDNELDIMEVFEKVEEEKINQNVAYVVNISYLSGTPSRLKGKNKKNQKLEDNYIIDIPSKIFDMEARLKDRSKYYDIVESFIYNTITRKTGIEVAHCQIYLSDF